jgi:hypothetical protein
MSAAVAIAEAALANEVTFVGFAGRTRLQKCYRVEVHSMTPDGQPAEIAFTVESIKRRGEIVEIVRHACDPVRLKFKVA